MITCDYDWYVIPCTCKLMLYVQINCMLLSEKYNFMLQTIMDTVVDTSNSIKLLKKNFEKILSRISFVYNTFQRLHVHTRTQTSVRA